MKLQCEVHAVMLVEVTREQVVQRRLKTCEDLDLTRIQVLFRCIPGQNT